MILVTAKTDDGYLVHDPGGEPMPDRPVTRDQLWHAMGADDRACDVTGFKLKSDIKGMRLDQYVVQERPRVSRSYAVKLIESGKVTVNGEVTKPGYRIREIDSIVIDFDETELDVIPEIDLPVLYENDDVIVINKPNGVISHARGKYWDEASVASFVRSKTNHMEGERARPATALSSRAGIVHRLDRATSGVMICAKNPETLKFLQSQFGDRKVTKTYVAIVSGHLRPEEAVIDMPIERNPKTPSMFRVGANGKPSQTHYVVAEVSPHHSELRLTPKTGRTHQLRVHLKQLGHPIVGDTLYDGEPAERLFLHAQSLELTLPDGTHKVFEAPLPKEFKELLRNDG